MNQKEFIADYIAQNRAPFNDFFFQRNEDDIVNELMNVIYSCQRDNKYFTIRVHSYQVIDNYDDINRELFNYYEDLTKKKSKSKKRDNQYGYINLNDSCIKLLKVTYYLRDNTDEDYVDVLIALPRIVDKYYFKINGIMRSTLFQIVDGSTYNNGTSNAKVPSITLKITFMAVRVTRYYNMIQTTSGEDLRLTYYHSRIFNKGVPAAKYILAKYGYYDGLRFMGFDSNSVFLTDHDPRNPNIYTFKAATGVYVNSPKYLMDRNVLLQSVVITLCGSIAEGVPMRYLTTDEYWLRCLGIEFNGLSVDKLADVYSGADKTITDPLDKGYSILDSFESIYDITTRNSIKLPMEDKETTYHVLRWIMREFNALRMKNNLDIRYKKIRFAEYIASIYAMKIARGIYRISDMNKKATVGGIKKCIRTDPCYLLTAITKSKMVSYRNMVSDMDSMQALKFTYKGVSGLGENSNNSIPDIYRSIHPSHIGRVDLDASSDGNPGITGTICPYAITQDGFFEDYQEPNSWEEQFIALSNEYENTLNRIDIMIFDEVNNNIDNSSNIELNKEFASMMQQIIKPIMYANEGEIVTMEENNYVVIEED